jgi:hypothetical protein
MTALSPPNNSWIASFRSSPRLRQLQMLEALPPEARRVLEQDLGLRPLPMLERLRQDPTLIMSLAAMTPDPWQEKVLCSANDRVLLLCSRQAGKSTLAAALSLKAALLEPGSLVLLLSPTQRQSGELFRDKVLRIYNALGRPVPVRQESQLQMELVNGSRVISLPENEATIRGYSGVRLLVIDEASRVSDDLYRAVRPMLAVSQGRLVCLSTPFGRRGWFFQAWDSGMSWERVRVTALECPRITPEFLADEERTLGARWYRQEYFCSFEEAVDCVFSPADVLAALNSQVQPLLTEPIFGDD